jgi:fructosamine-3-kinase
MKKETNTMEFRAKSDVKALGCKNNAMMIAEGVRPDYIKIDRKEFTKSDAERKVLKDLKRKVENYVNYGFHYNEPKLVKIKVHLINNNKSNYFKTTHTDLVPEYIANSIKNTKTYRISELDFNSKYHKVEYAISHLFINNKLIKL